jgi:hypothetical protein
MGKKKKSYRKRRSLNLDGSATEMIVDENPARNIKYHEIAKEFVNNGCRQTLAYATVVGRPVGKCGTMATRLFRKPFMIDLIRAYIAGDHEVPRTKDWAIKKWTEMVESNVLNYIDDTGEFLSIAELRLLPDYAQQAIKKIKVTTERDDDTGRTTQRVEIELLDKQKALADLARAEKWIETHMNINVTAPVSAEALIDAQIRRQKMLESRVIEGRLEQKHDRLEKKDD